MTLLVKIESLVARRCYNMEESATKTDFNGDNNKCEPTTIGFVLNG